MNADEPTPPSSDPSPRPTRPHGRAQTFRQEQARRRSLRWERAGELFVVVIIVLGVYTILTARPYGSTSSDQLPGIGPPIVVHLGSPAESSVTCTAGGTAYAERIPWTNSTQPVTTGDLSVRVTEIWDGDYIGDPHAVANVTPSNLCAGAPPDASAKWYVVLAAPNGTNLLTYTGGTGWVSVTHGDWNLGVENDSALILVWYAPLAGTGRGISLDGAANGSLISGSIAL